MKMEVPAPPLYNRTRSGLADEGGADARNESMGGGNIYSYGSSQQLQNSTDHSVAVAESPQSQYHAQQQQQQAMLGQQYYEYYRTSSQSMTHDHDRVTNEASTANHKGGTSYEQHYNSSATGISDSASQLQQDANNSTSNAMPTSPTPPTKQQYSYYGNYNNKTQSIYDTNYDQQCTDQVEQLHDQSYQHRLDQAAYNAFSDEGDGINNDTIIAPSSTPLLSIKEKLLPNVLTLAQKLLPMVLKRLDHQHDTNENVRIELNDDDDFEGTCSPLVGSTSPATSPQKKQPLAFYAYNTPKSKKDNGNNNNLKTTGLEESDYKNDNDDDVDKLEAGDAAYMNMNIDPNDSEYLPQSAALLVSALEGSARKIQRFHNTTEDDDDNNGDEDDDRFDNLPTLMDEALASEAEEKSAVGGGLKGSPPLRRMNSIEQEAEEVLESILRKDELDSRRFGRFSKRTNSSGSSSRRSSLGDAEVGGVAAAAKAMIGGSQAFDDDYDDDGSISGDMAQLTQSIAHLQRDLENVNFSHLEEAFALEDYDHDDGDGSGLLTRLKLWFSRGMIMEQKLLHTYVHPGSSDDRHDDGTTTETSGRYADNPILVWSLAIMWAFVVLILMHPKIAELVEGGDPGQLADIIEWMFG